MFRYQSKYLMNNDNAYQPIKASIEYTNDKIYKYYVANGAFLIVNILKIILSYLNYKKNQIDWKLAFVAMQSQENNIFSNKKDNNNDYKKN